MREVALCYFSRLDPSLGSRGVREIIDSSARNNAIEGITGCLVIDGGFFAQVLEGPEDRIRTLAERISRDPRHHDMRIVWLDGIEERAFDDWFMGGIDLTRDTDPDSPVMRSLRQDLHRFLRTTPDGSQAQFPEFFRHCVACLRDRVLPEEIVIEPPSWLRAG